MSEETKRLMEERAKAMLARGFVSTQEAAALAKVPRSNIYHWIKSGELGVAHWAATGANNHSVKTNVFVSLVDLQAKVPAAFAKTKTMAITPATTPPKRLLRKGARARAATS